MNGVVFSAWLAYPVTVWPSIGGTDSKLATSHHGQPSFIDSFKRGAVALWLERKTPIQIDSNQIETLKTSKSYKASNTYKTSNIQIYQYSAASSLCGITTLFHHSFVQHRRKLSTTIGWRTVSVTDIVEQAKSLCGQYIRARLKRAGVFNRKLGLQRLRSVANLQPGGLVVCEVFAQLHAIGLELERMHPKLYSGVAKQVSD